MKAVLSENRIHSKKTSVSGTEGASKVFFNPINRVSIDDSSQNVELIT